MTEKINGIAFFDEGLRGGASVVLIHGFPFNHTMWQPQIEALSKRYRVISYDVRGHGQSDCGDGQYTMELFVDDLFLLLEHLKVGRGVLVGLSMGGYVALRAVEREAGRFSGLVLCDTKSEADGDEAKAKRAAAVSAVKKNGVGPFAETFLKTVLAEKTLRSNPALVEQVRGMILGNSVLGVCGALMALAGRTDTTPALPKLDMPVLILVGEEDKLTPPSASESMQKAIPHALMHVIPGAAHLSNLENPAVFNERLRSYLTGVAASS